MQLLLRRRITEPVTTVKFILWAKFEVSPEQQTLLRRYKATEGYITIEQSRRDFYRAAVISFFIALVVTGTLVSAIAAAPGNKAGGLPPWVAVLIFVFLFVGATWAIYEQLREAIRISDMLTGREFKHKSLILMARRERRMIGYAHAFVQFLEKLKEWEGTEVIEIGEEDDHESALRLVTDTYVAAA
jgi:hypothetical protein